MNIRGNGASAKLIFIDLISDDTKVQIMANKQLYGAEDVFVKDHVNIRRGDIIGVVGFPGRSKTNELTLRAKSTTHLSYCLH